jgi:hypothetical protein
MDLHWRPSQILTEAPALPAGYLFGWVDTSVPGHRLITEGASLRTLASGYYRGDALAAALTTAGLPTTFASGRFTCTPGSATTLTSTDRLAVLLGLTARAGQQLASAATHTSTVFSPVAIPHVGAMWQSVVVDADDVLSMSRQQRSAGYVWGGTRVWDVTLTLSRPAVEALAQGWCHRGRVTVHCGTDAPMSASEPRGYIQGAVLSVSAPSWMSSVETFATVTIRIAEATA